MIIKTEEEREILREGGRRLGTYLKELASLVKVGVTSRELEEKALGLIESGADEPAFKGYKSRKGEDPYPSALCVSVNDAIVHSPASENNVTFEDGDIVTLDFGIKHRGLYTDHATTMIVGTPKSKEEELLVRGAFEALQLGIDQARAGKYTGDIGYAVQRVAEKYKFGYPKMLSGHGVGRSVHEAPHVPNFGTPGKGDKLVEGLVIAIEPMFTLGTGDLYIDKDTHTYRTKDGSRTSHVEHTVIVGKNGAEVITKV